MATRSRRGSTPKSLLGKVFSAEEATVEAYFSPLANNINQIGQENIPANHQPNADNADNADNPDDMEDDATAEEAESVGEDEDIEGGEEEEMEEEERELIPTAARAPTNMYEAISEQAAALAAKAAPILAGLKEPAHLPGIDSPAPALPRDPLAAAAAAQVETPTTQEQAAAAAAAKEKAEAELRQALEPPSIPAHVLDRIDTSELEQVTRCSPEDATFFDEFLEKQGIKTKHESCATFATQETPRCDIHKYTEVVAGTAAQHAPLTGLSSDFADKLDAFRLPEEGSQLILQFRFHAATSPTIAESTIKSALVGAGINPSRLAGVSRNEEEYDRPDGNKTWLGRFALRLADKLTAWKLYYLHTPLTITHEGAHTLVTVFRAGSTRGSFNFRLKTKMQIWIAGGRIKHKSPAVIENKIRDTLVGSHGPFPLKPIGLSPHSVDMLQDIYAMEICEAEKRTKNRDTGKWETTDRLAWAYLNMCTERSAELMYQRYKNGITLAGLDTVKVERPMTSATTVNADGTARPPMEAALKLSNVKDIDDDSLARKLREMAPTVQYVPQGANNQIVTRTRVGAQTATIHCATVQDMQVLLKALNADPKGVASIVIRCTSVIVEPHTLSQMARARTAQTTTGQSGQAWPSLPGADAVTNISQTMEREMLGVKTAMAKLREEREINKKEEEARHAALIEAVHKAHTDTSMGIQRFQRETAEHVSLQTRTVTDRINAGLNAASEYMVTSVNNHTTKTNEDMARTMGTSIESLREDTKQGTNTMASLLQQLVHNTSAGVKRAGEHSPHDETPNIRARVPMSLYSALGAPAQVTPTVNHTPTNNKMHENKKHSHPPLPCSTVRLHRRAARISETKQTQRMEAASDEHEDRRRHTKVKPPRPKEEHTNT